MPSKLYVGNLSLKTIEQDLNELFAQAGAVQSAVIIKDRMTGASRGFGFVEMQSEAEANAAIEKYNGYELEGRKIVVSQARERSRDSFRPGGGENRRGPSRRPSGFGRPDRGGRRADSSDNRGEEKAWWNS